MAADSATPQKLPAEELELLLPASGNTPAEEPQPSAPGEATFVAITAAYTLILCLLNEPVYASVILACGLLSCPYPKPSTKLWYLSRFVPFLELVRFQVRFFNGSSRDWVQTSQCLVSGLTIGLVGMNVGMEAWRTSWSPEVVDGG